MVQNAKKCGCKLPEENYFAVISSNTKPKLREKIYQLTRILFSSSIP